MYLYEHFTEILTMPFFFQLKWLLADKEHENKLLKEKGEASGLPSGATDSPAPKAGQKQEPDQRNLL